MWKHLEKRPLTRLGKLMAMIVILVMMMVRMVRVKMIFTNLEVFFNIVQKGGVKPMFKRN